MIHALVVDDKEENTLYLRALLEGAGWTVVVTNHGADALALARQTPPDIVISDLLMPMMDGYALLRQWKADARLRAVPFVVYTATYTEADDERLAMDLGADVFLLKPTEPIELLARLENALRDAQSSHTFPHATALDHPTQLKLYSETLVRKLEEKSLELARSNEQLKRDLGARVRAEAALHDREERLAMLLALNDALRVGANRTEFLTDAMRITGTHLGVTSCLFVELSGDNQEIQILASYSTVSPIVLGLHQNSPFGRALVAGFRLGAGAVVINDTVVDLGAEAHAGMSVLGISAFVGVPYIRVGGQLCAMVATMDKGPRSWTPSEVVLLREVLERCSARLESEAVEARLRRNEAMLRVAGKAALVGGWTVEVPSLEIAWTDEVCAIHEVPAGTKLSLLEAFEHYAPEFRDSLREKFMACVSAGVAFDVEAQLITATKRKIWVRSVGLPGRDLAGAITQIQGALQNIDERHKLEDQLRQAQKMEAVGRLAGGVAHDFNNLLSVILSYTAFLLEDLPPGNPIRADIEEVHNAGQRATDLTRQLLTFSRQQVMRPIVLDLGLVLRGMERMLRRLVNEEIELTIVTAPLAGRVYADPSQVEQIIMNLAVNASDAMERGGRLALEVTVTTLDAAYATEHHDVAPGRYVLLTVVDTGTGIDAATREHIFEPFFTTKEASKGTGLGLSTVFGIVSRSGGHITVSSEVGCGTTFRVYLPCTDKLEQVIDVATPPTSNRGSETILVVEDDEQVRTMICTLLRRQGYTVLDAANGGEALLICEEFSARIHLLLTDVIMPRLGGRELAERLRLLQPEMRVIYVSGYTESAIMRHGVLDSGITFLHKPLAPRMMLGKVREVLDLGA